MSTSLQEAIVSGPTETVGLGRTVFIDPCQQSFRQGVFLSQAVVVTTAAKRLIELNKAGDKIRTILVAGEQDPLQHPDFREISENLKEIAKKHHPKAQLVLVGYPRFIDSPGRAVALDFFHQVVLRLEAGTQKTYAAMTGEKGPVFKKVCSILSKLDVGGLTVRARFVRGDIDNSTPSEIRGWIAALKDMRPARVEVCTPKKSPWPKTKPITATRLKEIVAAVEEQLGVPVDVIEE